MLFGSYHSNHHAVLSSSIIIKQGYEHFQSKTKTEPSYSIAKLSSKSTFFFLIFATVAMVVTVAVAMLL